MMKKAYTNILMTCLLASFALIAVPALSWADHGWGNYHWARTVTPMPLLVVDSVDFNWQSELDIALSEWNQSVVLNMEIASSNDSNRIRKQCKMKNGQIRVCNSSYGFNGWLGMATIGLDSNGKIDRGTAKVNDSYASYWEDPNEKRHVMCQELGHLFGLGHTSVDGSSQKTCMDYSSDSYSISPNPHDYDFLFMRYAHLDSYNSYDDGADSGDGGNKACNPRKPGCNGFDLPVGVPAGAVPVNRGSHAETWVKSRPDGGLWIFHIRLAPGGPGKD